MAAQPSRLSAESTRREHAERAAEEGQQEQQQRTGLEEVEEAVESPSLQRQRHIRPRQRVVEAAVEWMQPLLLYSAQWELETSEASLRCNRHCLHCRRHCRVSWRIRDSALETTEAAWMLLQWLLQQQAESQATVSSQRSHRQWRFDGTHRSSCQARRCCRIQPRRTVASRSLRGRRWKERRLSRSMQRTKGELRWPLQLRVATIDLCEAALSGQICGVSKRAARGGRLQRVA